MKVRIAIVLVVMLLAALACQVENVGTVTPSPEPTLTSTITPTATDTMTPSATPTHTGVPAPRKTAVATATETPSIIEVTPCPPEICPTYTPGYRWNTPTQEIWGQLTQIFVTIIGGEQP